VVGSGTVILVTCSSIGEKVLIGFFFTFNRNLTPYHFAVPKELKARADRFWLFQKAKPHTHTTVQTMNSEQSRLEVVPFINFLVADTGLGDFPE
jgi:hypothetical protein